MHDFLHPLYASLPRIAHVERYTFLTLSNTSINWLISAQNGDMRSPKRLCTENRNVLVERNSFTSPVKDRLLHLSNLKSKLLPPPLQSAFARYKSDESWSNILYKFALFQIFTTLMLVHLVTVLNVVCIPCSPTKPNPGGGGETCAETGISVFFSKVLSLESTVIPIWL